ncbi:S41 family peptidase [Bacillus tianshenii]|nr:S41 family peptidase [Bacillus tianshenii]
MRFLRYRLSILFALLLFFTAFVPAGYASPLDEVRDLLEKYYVDKLDEDVLQEDSVSEMLEHLDPYTAYFTKDEMKMFIQSIEQSYAGIGIMVDQKEDKIEVTNVFPDSPASKVGVLTGDTILGVNGKSVEGNKIEEVTKMIKGEAGTSVLLTLKHSGARQPYVVEIMRKEVKLPSVTTEQLGGNIGYMKVSVFNDQTVTEMKKALKYMNDVEKWIVDLRNNPGGYVSAAQRMTGLFPDVEKTLVMENRFGSYTFPAFTQTTQFKGETALLVNNQSASASEIVAGAVKDGEAATIYGEKTFGKGLMQKIYELSDGSALKMTTSRFYTPKYNQINDVGVEPDVATETPLEDAHFQMLLENHKNYQEMAELTEVVPDKKFEIRFTQPIDITTFNPDTVQLIELGGKEIEYKSEMTDNRTLSIKPEKPLEVGNEYVLFVHPNWKTSNHKLASKGIYVQVKVKA